MSTPHLDLRFGAHTDKGMVRAHNEDSYLTAYPYFLVADGMGGHARGEVASKAAVDSFLPFAGRQWANPENLTQAIAEAGLAVTELAGEGRPPGSTLAGVGVALQNAMPCWLVFNIGDSRVYLMRDGKLSQISIDHSAIRECGGAIQRNVITRALGAGLSKPLVADQWIFPIHAGDTILVCSDGLYNEVTDQLIAALLLSNEEPRDKAAELIWAANRAGGRDNVTAVVVIADQISNFSAADALGENTLPDRDDTLQEED